MILIRLSDGRTIEPGDGWVYDYLLDAWDEHMETRNSLCVENGVCVHPDHIVSIEEVGDR